MLKSKYGGPFTQTLDSVWFRDWLDEIIQGSMNYYGNEITEMFANSEFLCSR